MVEESLLLSQGTQLGLASGRVIGRAIRTLGVVVMVVPLPLGLLKLAEGLLGPGQVALLQRVRQRLKGIRGSGGLARLSSSLRGRPLGCKSLQGLEGLLGSGEVP